MREYLREIGSIIRPIRMVPPALDGDHFSADLHIHSLYSPDCKSELPHIIDQALVLGISLISITDHFVDRAFVELARNGNQILGEAYSLQPNETFIIITKEERRLVLVKGKEISTDRGHHVIALAYVGQVHNFNSLEQTLGEIRRHQGLAILAHPCNTISHGVGPRILHRLAAAENTREIVDAIEVFNANGSFPMFWSNLRSEKTANSLRMSGIASSDAHQVRHIGRSLSIFEGCPDLSSDSRFSASLRECVRRAPREHLKSYVPVPEFLDWFVMPKITSLLKGDPVTIRPPAYYEDY